MKSSHIEQNLARKRKVYYGLGLFILAIMLFPLIIKNLYYLNVLIFVGIHTIIVIGLSLLFGYAGQISLGQAAFYGLGAYTSGVLTTKFAVSPWVAFAVAIVLTGVIAYLIGMPILRLTGHYLAMGTLGFGIIANIIFVEWYSMTGGHSGLVNISTLSIFGFELNNDIRYYYLVWSIVPIVFLFSYNLINSKVGKALKAISESEIASEVLGINTFKYKLEVFVLSGVYASIAGSLYAHYVTFLTPDIFGTKISIDFIVMVVVGGLGSIWGSVFGVFMLTILPEYFRAYKDYDIILYGVVLILLIMFLPGGLEQVREILIGKLKTLKCIDLKALCLRKAK